MHTKRNPALIPYARELRKDMTAQEKRLWYDYLRTYPVKFTRQKILGYYIADYYCAKAKLVVELDGVFHLDREEMQYDLRRDRFITKYGIKVIRFTDNQLDIDFLKVCSIIDKTVKERLKELEKRKMSP